MASPFYVRIEVADRPGVLALVALRLAAKEISVARLVQRPGEGSATLHIVTHEAPAGRLRDALDEIDAPDDPRACLGARGDLGPRRG